MEYFDVKSDWVASPDTWVGLHYILEWTHGIVLAIILGIFWTLVVNKTYK